MKTRYFFDVASKSSIRYDYKGRELECFESVRDLAELVALDLECSDDGAWAGSEVRVHDANGEWVFSIEVKTNGLMAA